MVFRSPVSRHAIALKSGTGVPLRVIAVPAGDNEFATESDCHTVPDTVATETVTSRTAMNLTSPARREIAGRDSAIGSVGAEPYSSPSCSLALVGSPSCRPFEPPVPGLLWLAGTRAYL